MTTFAGFPAGKNPYVPVPEIFFTQVLPEIEDNAELKVTLHLFWLLAQKKGDMRCTNDDELLADRVLLYSLKRHGDSQRPEERLTQGLGQALVRGTILKVDLKKGGTSRHGEERIGWYFFNTARSRKIVALLQGGEVLPGYLFKNTDEFPDRTKQANALTVSANTYMTYNGARIVEPSTDMQIAFERPNIFTLYEQNIGVLVPSLADQLRDAEEEYPEAWIEAAFREAVLHNKRNWKYINAILQRWKTEGRQ